MEQNAECRLLVRARTDNNVVVITVKQDAKQATKGRRKPQLSYRSAR